MKEMAITMSTAKTPPDYRKTAGLVLDACRDFYKEPENMEAFLMQKKGGQNGGTDHCRVCAG